MVEVANNANVDIVNIGDEVTFHREAGTSTATDIYLNFDSGRKVLKLNIANNKAFVVVDINTETFTNPRTVSAAKGFGMTFTFMDSLESVKIRTTQANTHLEVMMW